MKTNLLRRSLLAAALCCVCGRSVTTLFAAEPVSAPQDNTAPLTIVAATVGPKGPVAVTDKNGRVLFSTTTSVLKRRVPSSQQACVTVGQPRALRVKIALRGQTAADNEAADAVRKELEGALLDAGFRVVTDGGPAEIVVSGPVTAVKKNERGTRVAWTVETRLAVDFGPDSARLADGPFARIRASKAFEEKSGTARNDVDARKACADRIAAQSVPWLKEKLAPCRDAAFCGLKLDHAWFLGAYPNYGKVFTDAVKGVPGVLMCDDARLDVEAETVESTVLCSSAGRRQELVDQLNKNPSLLIGTMMYVIAPPPKPQPIPAQPPVGTIAPPPPAICRVTPIALSLGPWAAPFGDCDWDVYGLRLNLSLPGYAPRHRNVYGIDLGISGEYAGDGGGIAVNFLNNRCRDFTGIQLGGFMNQNTGVTPFAVQMAFLHNGTEDFGGLQVSLWNKTRTLHGIQIGLVNFADNGGGLQIGLWNANASFGSPVLGIVF